MTAATSHQAEAFKDEGNNYFKAGNYAKAVVYYTKAIDLAYPDDDGYESDSTTALDSDQSPAVKEKNTELLAAFPDLHVYLSNRAMANIKLENFGLAIADATKAVELKPGFAKAYYRRGCAKVALTKYKDALKDFERCCQLSPQDQDAKTRLRECRKEVQAQAFAKAIATESTAKVSETIDISQFSVPSTYDGPVYESGKVSPEFLKSLLAYMKDQKTVCKKFGYQIALDAIKLLKDQPTLVRINVRKGERFSICGDIHGQYYDLLNIFEINGLPSEDNPYLFNGDFVDRGSFSVECILALFAFKLAYPNHMFLARGNHEAKSMNRLYGFEGEITAKYDNKLYALFCEAFCLLPLAHVVNNRIFVVHGGLFGRDGVLLKDIDAVDRDREPPEEGLMADMMWADPIAVRGRHPSKRGMGLSFGPDVTENFLKTNDLQMVVRSHEVKDDGYEVEHGGKLITVFSAPNYCDQMNNRGALLNVTFPDELKGDAKIDFKSFSAVPHPPVKAMHYANKALFGPMFGFGG